MGSGRLQEMASRPRQAKAAGRKPDAVAAARPPGKQRAGTEGKVRIVGGAWRSRVLRFPTLPDLRPTSDRLRETLFNWLGQDLTGKVCLDLFAGSGALGFEALSRNAKAVVMVEYDAAVRAALSQNARLLGAGARLHIVGGDALGYLRGATAPFDVVFCDPPFREDWFTRLWNTLPPLLAPGGLLYAESGVMLTPPPPWQVIKSGKAGQVFYQLLKVENHGESGLPRHV